MKKLTTKDGKQIFIEKNNYEFAYSRKKIQFKWDLEFDCYHVEWLTNNKESHVEYMNFK